MRNVCRALHSRELFDTMKHLHICARTRPTEDIQAYENRWRFLFLFSLLARHIRICVDDFIFFFFRFVSVCCFVVTHARNRSYGLDAGYVGWYVWRWFGFIF